MSADIERVYLATSGELSFAVDASAETVWATHQQIADLFGVDRSGATRHINNVLATEEVDRANNVQKMHIAGAKRPVSYYSLDVILAVGYRVNSGEAIRFRRWATGVLREHLVAGYTVNEQRLTQIGKVLEILQRADDELVSGVADLLARFTDGLDLLDRFDHQSLTAPGGAVSDWEFTYPEARSVIDAMSFGTTSQLFGHERDGSFPGVIAGLYQSFGGVDLYPTAQEKAAHLLYLVVKDHCFSDGNKRIAAALFVYFLDRCGLLTNAAGRARIGNSTLAAITVMIAVSRPEEKDDMVLLVRNLLEVGE
ncbi:MAG TPA: RhuM family protein [Propionicimonas sp.]|nr:RhuM family protein [Propionicimonas sp.]